MGKNLTNFHESSFSYFLFLYFLDLLEAAQSSKDQPASDGGAMDTKLAGFLKVLVSERCVYVRKLVYVEILIVEG